MERVVGFGSDAGAGAGAGGVGRRGAAAGEEEEPRGIHSWRLPRVGLTDLRLMADG